MEERLLKIINEQMALINQLKTDKDTWFKLWQAAVAVEKELNAEIVRLREQGAVS